MKEIMISILPIIVIAFWIIAASSVRGRAAILVVSWFTGIIMVGVTAVASMFWSALMLMRIWGIG